MWDRIWRVAVPANRHASGAKRQSALRSRRTPSLELLEDRRLMTASLAQIDNLTVPAQLGYQVPLNGSGSNNPTQSFTATSSNPDIKVSIAQGQFWTLTVSHQPANSSDVTINNETMTFQLFQDLTPTTSTRITNLTGSGYYTNGFPNTTPPTLPGKFIPRITSVANSSFAVVQGGSSSATSTASFSGIPPIGTEPVQQLAFTGQSQIAMANTGQPNSTDAQFFITNGVPSTSIQQSFDFNYTIFGQLVSGQQTLTDLGNVAVTTNSSGEKSQPITPVVINAATLSSTNPNGVLHVDTTSARLGETATITVTATDPTDKTTVTRSFVVTVSAYNGPTNPVINFVPLANPVATSATVGTPTTVQLNGKSGYPSASASVALTYQLVSQPSHGTITNFNASTGTLTYTPQNNFLGSDTFHYTVTSTGPNAAPATLTSLAGTVQVTIGSGVTGAVRVIHTVLVVDPPPRTGRVTNTIGITQIPDATTGGQKLQVTVNGIPDSIQPSTSLISQIVVFGTKASDNITVDPSVTIPATLDGGHGGKNLVKGGGGVTLEHGWFGHTLLAGGVGPNELIGRKGFVRFVPSSATTLVFAGVPRSREKDHRTISPGGTFYRFRHGHLVPVWSLGSASPPKASPRSPVL
jgi:cyclophilin family peptidyl-prolyl cis-trans isomerase